ncbi:MAG TPA: DEAD/DEAH box helicase family protein [Vicinamibacterales bacterium]|nr:DEAD/DEAH box helicase family protein [Vicinamibacterales bacterium]
MKLHFEPNLDHQTDAVKAVCDLFRGQEICRTEFTVTREALAPQQAFEFHDSELGIGNRLSLLDDQILSNLRDVQLRNGLRPSDVVASGDFTVEMETGTGKTYVYLKTIFELNKQYGFTKFVIVVPSVAIKEGVHKTIQITGDHFRGLYAGVPFDPFPYDSSKLGQVRNFATSAQIQIMVVTVGAINKKDVNNLYKDSEKTGGEKPIDLIKATRPIVIVDEPQSVDGGLSGAGKAALSEMHPLCTLRYSATHVDKHHMVYRLDALDAYQKHLVKQIEVDGGTVVDAHNKPYVRLVSVSSKKKGGVSAVVELDVATSTGVRRQRRTVWDGYDLQQESGRAAYADCRIGEIRAEKGNESVELRTPGGEQYLKQGDSWGDVDALAVQREMIRRTILQHLEKEKKLRPQGIKVLSLFFIDVVDKYRKYDGDGNPVKGDYALIFEQEYRRLAKSPAFADLFKDVDLSHAAEAVHNGYFSIDRNKKWSEPELDKEGNLKNQTSRDDAERAYQLIMRDKEELLRLDTPLKFIFSHSALREGWDNPNVFQICALRDISTTRERRQTIGRGMRLCVNQDGLRVRGFDVNTLTVVATERFEDFAKNLQKEIEEDTGIRFGILEDHQFASIAVVDAEGRKQPLGFDQSRALWGALKAQGHIDTAGKVQDSLKVALRDGTLEVPDAFKPQTQEILDILRKVAGKLEIKNANERRQVRPRAGVLHGADFKALWERIKFKTTYRVAFDNEKLIRDCARALREAPAIPKARLQWRKAGLAIGQGGVEAVPKPGSQTVTLDEQDIELPDVLTDLQDKTQLTRRSISRILLDSGRLDDFKRNPQEFIEIAADVINGCKRLALVDGIVYKRLGNDQFYAQELFEKDELTGYIRNMLQGTQKCVFEDVVYDSGTEREFAQRMEDEMAVKVYAKLPSWFQIPTPLGPYNPDWAVGIEESDGERLYFVVETKGSLLAGDLRAKEAAKIECGRVHFRALAEGTAPAQFLTAKTLDELLSGR